MQTNLGKKLVAVIDVHELKLFAAEGLKITNNVGNYTLVTQEDHDSHISDKHQNFYQKKSGPGSFFDPHTSVKEIDLKVASKEASKQLDNFFKEKSDYKDLIIVCNDKLLGALRDTLPANVKKMISKEVHKDLIHHTTDSIEKLVFGS